MKCSLIFVIGVLSLGCAMATIIPRENDWHMMQCPEGNLKYFLLQGNGMKAIPYPPLTVTGEIRVYGNNSIIFISLKVEYEGTHLCLIEKDNTVRAHELPLRVRPKPPTDLWGQVYESMFVTGLIAAMVIALIFALGCLVYKKQWRPTPGHISEDTKPVLSYDNPAMSEDAETGSTHM